MWRRAYLLLALVRLYFALSPSYLHPDENFQGPEVIAGQIFSYPVKLTWEFTDPNPIRSVFPLWPIYGLPMLLLKWLWIGAQHSATSEISPKVVFHTLRVLMFFLSFVLEDWAIHELCPKPRERRVAMLLLSSSYVTWTFQSHTFSNSIETIVVLWSLVLVQRILDDRRRTSPFASALLAILVVFGTFTRITFPAFLIIPGFRLLPHFYQKPLSFLIMVATGLATLLLAIAIDTELYTPHPVSLTTLFTHPVITPLNNLRYNLNSSNLALHGTHPYYQHALINLPQLLGPAFLLLFLRPKVNLRFWSAISGLVVLSAFSHQEARFLLPCVPLLLSCIRLPGRRQQRLFMGVWVAFNVVMGVLMGTYHQGGVVPVQFWLAENAEVGGGNVVWWRTYSPPVWLLDGKNEVLATHDMMGVSGTEMIQKLGQLVTCEDKSLAEKVAEVVGVTPKNEIATYLVAPLSAKFMSTYTSQKEESRELEFEKVFQYRTHLNLDDMDFGDDGVWPTIRRVIGRRGLAVWRVTKRCGEPEVLWEDGIRKDGMGTDRYL